MNQEGAWSDLDLHEQLPSGLRIRIGPLLAEHAEELRRAYEDRTSDHTKLWRFLAPTPTLTEWHLRHLVDTVDGVDHVAFLAWTDDDPSALIGSAHLIRYKDSPTDADAAVTVADAWQGQGVATALLRLLLSSRPAGVTRLVTSVYTSNVASIRLLKRTGPTQFSRPEHGVTEATTDIPQTGPPG